MYTHALNSNRWLNFKYHNKKRVKNENNWGIFFKYLYSYGFFNFFFTGNKTKCHGEAKVQLCSNGTHSAAEFKNISFDSGKHKIFHLELLYYCMIYIWNCVQSYCLAVYIKFNFDYLLVLIMNYSRNLPDWSTRRKSPGCQCTVPTFHRNKYVLTNNTLFVWLWYQFGITSLHILKWIVFL